ncbi:9157_t:CDS:2 [Dentiscutata heterogama]|uniref:9157_t:CDS:1 n=1 Tax=Dentiscutata heterogama TaxID=1316150 RepID=A0ACA9NKF6_9GLOM|nr:9157_t:CDS:2 [Dentiscutata heterogama]
MDDMFAGEDRMNVLPIKGEIPVDWEASLESVNGKLETVPRGLA